MSTPELFQAAWISSLKTKIPITDLLPNKTGEEIRECEYFSDKFVYPNIRVGIDYMPSINGCGPDDADVTIEIFSEEKSTKQAVHIASVIQGLYNKIPFKAPNGVRFSTVWVKKIDKPQRSIYAWVTIMKIFVQGV